MAEVWRTEVVQSIQNNIERLEPRHVKLRVFDVGVDRMYLDVGIECRRSVCSNLTISAFVNVMQARSMQWTIPELYSV